MVMAVDIAYTAGEIRSLLDGVPDSTPVEFHPISGGWLGASDPMRVHKECHVYDKRGNEAVLEQPDSHLVVYLHEFA